ncbi:hypothetical protein ENTCAN_06349 [Enterobacter cancerogenus ATCC 35316]|nr:hypothetical protein ENTCAN_06349 [Enterobacter cancerogenus ATCC 35316]
MMVAVYCGNPEKGTSGFSLSVRNYVHSSLLFSPFIAIYRFTPNQT